MAKPNKRARSKRPSNEQREPHRPNDSIDYTPLSRFELIVVIAFLLAGCGFRLAYPSRMSVEHFDEGVYASNIWFGAEVGYEYPQRRLYAPPLLPSLIEWSIIFENIRSPDSIRPTALATMAPSLVAGCLSLLAVWWTARDWFGPAAGGAALALAAFSDLHALYSRTALTEALLAWFLLVSLWAMRRSLSEGGFGWMVLSGVATGLAWWTKYNGWLPLAIGATSIVISLVADRARPDQLVRSGLCWAGITISAALIWSPYLWSLQEAGGYADISANHKQYVVGLAGWLPGLLRQYANLNHYDSVASCCGIALSVAVVAASSKLTRVRAARCCSLAFMLTALAAWLGSVVVLLTLSSAFFASQFRESWLAPESGARRRFAWPLSAAWVIGLFFATPLYHPYPRLTLPWVCGLWLAGSAGISQLLATRCFSGRDTSPVSDRWLYGGAIIASLLLAVAGATGQVSGPPAAWQSRVEWQPIAERIVDAVSSQARQLRSDPSEAIVFVYGEPALFFHLNAVGPHAYIPARDMGLVDSASEVPLFLVAGPHADRSPSFGEGFSRVSSQMKLVAEYNYAPSDLVLLNQYSPHELRQEGGITQGVRLYEIIRQR